MPAELELVDQVEETEKTKSESETTKDICTKMVKAESEHTENNHGNGTVQHVPEVEPEPVMKENGTTQSVPDIVETPKENPVALPEAEMIPDANSQPDIVLESESPQAVQEPEVCQLPTLIPAPEPVVEEPRVPSPERLAEQVPVVEETTTTEVFSNGHQSQEQEEPILECPRQPAPVVQSLEPKSAPEVRSETVKKLIQQTEQDADSKAPVIQNGTRKKVQMMTSLDEHAVRSAYDDVRADNTETQWAVFKFQGSCIVKSAVGSEFEKFKAQFTENERAFGFIRVQVGDEMSKRQKFVFITWVGPAVSVIQRAKMSTDKALMKHIISNFAVELQPETLAEINLDHFKMELNKAGGANYGTGVRDS